MLIKIKRTSYKLKSRSLALNLFFAKLDKIHEIKYYKITILIRDT